jgi:hypothetical protein
MPAVVLTPEQLKLLEGIGQRRPAPITFHAVIVLAKLDPAVGREAGDVLEDLGLIEDFGPRNVAGKRITVRLTGAGRQLLAQIGRERKDPIFRRVTCRRQLLIFAAQDPTPSPWPRLSTFIEDPSTGVHSAPFTLLEARLAAVHLQGERLLEFRSSIGEDGTFKITHSGSRCVEDFDGDVNAWERHQMKPAAHQIIFNQGHGSSANAILGDNNNASQSAASTATVEEYTKWAEDLLKILPAFQLPDDQAARVEEAAARIQAEAEGPSASPSRLRVLGQTARDLLIRGLQDAALAQAPLLAQGILESGERLFGQDPIMVS